MTQLEFRGEFKFINDVAKIEKIQPSTDVKPIIQVDTEEMDSVTPKSPSYDPFTPTTPESMVPTINAPIQTGLLEQEDYESTDDEDDSDYGYDDEEDIYGDVKKPKITIVNEGEMDNKDLEILTVDDINKDSKGENGEEESEGDSSGVKKGIKIDV